MRARYIWALAAPLVLAAVLFAAAAPTPAAAQSTQAVAQCPAPEALNGIDVCVDRGDGAVYFEGDPITVCATWSIPVIAIYPPPPPPLVRVTNSVDGGPPRVLFEEHAHSGQRCITSFITPPLGQETIRGEVIATDGRVIAADTAHYLSVPRTSPPGAATLTVDRGPGGVYAVGEPIHYCFTVPGPSHIRILDLLPDGRTQVLHDFFDDGTGA